jgi:hypothetical protein
MVRAARDVSVAAAASPLRMRNLQGRFAFEGGGDLLLILTLKSMSRVFPALKDGARCLMPQARRLSTCASVATEVKDKTKRNILDLSFENMTEEIVRLGQPAYRSRQLWTYIYSKLGTSFDQVPSFPSSLKQQVIFSRQNVLPHTNDCVAAVARRVCYRHWCKRRL